MKRMCLVVLVLTAVGTATVQAATITNEWSGVAGDRANILGFAFQANAGKFPASIDPTGSLTPNILVTKVTLTRAASSDPNNPTTPSFGTGPRQTTDAATPVYLEAYTAADNDTDSFTGYLGSSTNAIAWQDMPLEGEDYSFDFANLPLQSGVKYWFAFSESNDAGDYDANDSANFRLRVNSQAASNQGGLYLPDDTFQILDQGGNPRDWAAAYVVDFTGVVPEPASGVLALGALGILSVRRRK